MPRPRRLIFFQQIPNATRNFANQSTEEDQEVAREERCVSKNRLRASHTQEQREKAHGMEQFVMRNRRIYHKYQQRDSLR